MKPIKMALIGVNEHSHCVQVHTRFRQLTDMFEVVAIAYPEKHENLVVRIGGYSEYFNRLSPALKQTVLERTEY